MYVVVTFLDSNLNNYINYELFKNRKLDIFLIILSNLLLIDQQVISLYNNKNIL